MVACDAVSLAMDFKSSWKVESANLMTDVVKSSEDLTSITGNKPEIAWEVFDLTVSEISKLFAVITLFRTLETKSSVSISTFDGSFKYSTSRTSAIDLK